MDTRLGSFFQRTPDSLTDVPTSYSLKKFTVQDPALQSSINVFFHLYRVINVSLNELPTWATAIWKAVIDFEEQAQLSTAWPESADPLLRRCRLPAERRPLRNVSPPSGSLTCSGSSCRRCRRSLTSFA
jgi:hypothetical protein